MNKARTILILIVAAFMLIGYAPAQAAPTPTPPAVPPGGYDCDVAAEYFADIFEIFVDNEDAIDAISELADSNGEALLTLSPTQLDRYGDALWELADAMSEYKPDPMMKNYHAAQTTSIAVIAQMFTMGADVGIIMAALLLSDLIEAATDEADRMDTALNRACPNASDDGIEIYAERA